MLKIQHGTNSMLYFLHKMHTVYLQTILIIIFKSVSHNVFILVNINYKNKIIWIGADLKKEIAQKNKLLATAKRYPTDENKRAYKSAGNTVISKLRKAERKHYDEQFDLYGNDNHKKWNVIREIIAKEDRSSTVQSEFIIDSDPTTNSEVIANSFNDFFVNVGKNLAENIKSDIDPLKKITNNVYITNTIEITDNKMLNIISTIKKSASGFEELPAFVMKQCSKLYAKQLCHVLSLSIRQGVFPNELKLAKVLPIYKSDDKRQLKNYKPISVLPFISKVLKKIVADSVIDFLEEVFLTMSSKKKSSNQLTPIKDSGQSTYLDYWKTSSVQSDLKNSNKDTKLTEEQRRQEWRMFARLCDKICLVIFLIIIVISTLVSVIPHLIN